MLSSVALLFLIACKVSTEKRLETAFYQKNSVELSNYQTFYEIGFETALPFLEKKLRSPKHRDGVLALKWLLYFVMVQEDASVTCAPEEIVRLGLGDDKLTINTVKDRLDKTRYLKDDIVKVFLQGADNSEKSDAYYILLAFKVQDGVTHWGENKIDVKRYENYPPMSVVEEWYRSEKQSNKAEPTR